MAKVIIFYVFLIFDEVVFVNAYGIIDNNKPNNNNKPKPPTPVATDTIQLQNSLYYICYIFPMFSFDLQSLSANPTLFH